MHDLEEFERDTVFIVLRWLVVSMIFLPLLLTASIPLTPALKICAIALLWELISKKTYAA